MSSSRISALGAELGNRGVDVLRRPEHEGVEDQPERAELVLHPVPVRLVDGAALAVAHVPGQLVPGLLHGELPVHLPAVGVIDRVGPPWQVLGPGDLPILRRVRASWPGSCRCGTPPRPAARPPRWSGPSSAPLPQGRHRTRPAHDGQSGSVTVRGHMRHPNGRLCDSGTTPGSAGCASSDRRSLPVVARGLSNIRNSCAAHRDQMGDDIVLGRQTCTPARYRT